MPYQLPSFLTNWWERHWLKLVRSTEDARPLARGMALGTFVGFSPFFGLKTLLALAIARFIRASPLAAILGVTLHDLILPLAPLIARWEYDLGFWIVSNPHRWPVALNMSEFDLHRWLNWQTLSETFGPLLLGCTLVGAPFAVAAYLLTQRLLRNKRAGTSA